MSAFRFILNDISVEIAAAFTGQKLARSNSMHGQIEEAATGAIRKAGEVLKTDGRANIAAGGLSVKWQNAWRVQIFPSKGVSIDAAVWAYHKIPYALIFQQGGRISGKRGLLWLPLSNVPKMGRTRASPRRLANSGVKLFTIRNPRGGRPLLGTAVRVSRAQAGQDKLSVSLSKLRSGTKGSRGTVRAIPLFFGVDTVTISKRFDLAGVATRVRGQLGDFYFANLRTGD